MAEQIANSIADPTTTLVGSINSSVTSLIVASAAELPSSGTFRLRIDDELITVGARSGTTLSTLGRGAEGTIAATHTNNSDVNLVLSAAGLTAFVSENGGSQPLFVQPDDPGAVGAGAVWVNTDDDPATIGIRNAGDTDWVPVDLHYVLGVGQDADGFEIQNLQDGTTPQSAATVAQLGSVPFVAPPGEDVVILKNSTGDTIMSGGEDTGGVHIAPTLQVTLLDVDEIQMNSGRIQNMADPQNPQDAVTRTYLDFLGLVLPTSDPALVGALWNDTGTVKVSAG